MQWKFIQHTINFQASNLLPPVDLAERQIDHIVEIVYVPAMDELAAPKNIHIQNQSLIYGVNRV